MAAKHPRIKHPCLLWARLFALAVLVVEGVLQILNLTGTYNAGFLLKYWGILVCTILFLYLLSLLLADISDSKRELFAWGLAVFTASLSGLCAFFDTGMPQVVLIFAGAFLFVGTLILGIVTLSERMDAAFYVSLLLLLILYAWGYVWGTFLWDMPTDGFPLGDLLLIPLSLALFVTDIRAHFLRSETQEQK